MFDVAIKRVPWAIAAVMALTLTGQAAAAQPGDEVDPSAAANIIEIQQSVVTRIDAATMRYHYFILNYAASPATTFKVRIRVFNQTIAPATLDQVADHIRVITSKKARP